MSAIQGLMPALAGAMAANAARPGGLASLAMGALAQRAARAGRRRATIRHQAAG
jgi:hypothetical protein